MEIERLVGHLIAFARYLGWADLVRSTYENAFAKSADLDSQHSARGAAFAWMSYWYSSLFVVIEAYETVGLKDPVIDALLAHPADYGGLLRRYRNGVFHFQADLVDSRLLNLLSRGEEHVLWVHALHGEFRRFLREQIGYHADTEETKEEMKRTVQELVGWLAEEPDVRKFDLTMERLRGLVERQPAPGLEAQHARLSEELRQMTQVRGTFEERNEQLRRDLLRRLGVVVCDSTGGE